MIVERGMPAEHLLINGLAIHFLRIIEETGSGNRGQQTMTFVKAGSIGEFANLTYSWRAAIYMSACPGISTRPC